jgi:NAD+ kinase
VETDHDAGVERLLSEGDITVRRMRRSHEDHETTVKEAEDAVRALGVRATFVRGPRTVVEGAGSFDLVVTVGGDGTLLAASHAIGPGIPLLGINSAPDHSVGFFCGAKKGEVAAELARAIRGELHATELSRMRLERNGTVLHARVLNEVLFCHSCPAATSRYILRVTDLAARGSATDDTTGIRGEEEQRSSGLWVGPAAGSTAAQKSAGGKVLALGSTAVQFVVREPYTPVGVPLRLATGLVDATQGLEIRSKMREGKLFVDGHHIAFDSTIGDVLTMRRSDETLTVLGLTRAG